MDYTKFFDSHHKYKLNLSDPRVKIAQDLLKEIQNSTVLISNYIRLGYSFLILDLKFDIDEYIAYFLKDKNEFLSEFEKIIQKSSFSKYSSNYNRLKKINYSNILSIINGKINKILSDYKFIKQKLLTKLSKKEKFYRIKDSFCKAKSARNELISRGDKSSPSSFTKSHIENQIIFQPNVALNEAKETDKKYCEPESVISTFKKQETDTLSDTKKIIFELSDLMTNFSSKVQEHQEVTNIIFSDSKSALQNIKDGNKELGISLENQKNRGLYIGMLFIFLGFFLIFYDYNY